MDLIPDFLIPNKEGVEQADLSSLFLFIISMKGIHVVLDGSISKDVFHGAKVGRNELTISYSFPMQITQCFLPSGCVKVQDVL